MWRLRHYVTLASSRRVGPLPGIWVQGLRAGKNIFLFFIFLKKIRKICREIFQKLKVLGFKRNTGVGFGAFRVTWKLSGHWDFIGLESCGFMLIGMRSLSVKEFLVRNLEEAKFASSISAAVQVYVD